MARIDSDRWTGRGANRAGILSAERAWKLLRILGPCVVLFDVIDVVLIVRDGTDLVRLVSPIGVGFLMIVTMITARERLRNKEAGK